MSEYDGVTTGPDPEAVPRETWPEFCMYKAYRNPPESEEPYLVNIKFWHVFTARLAFILVFEVKYKFGFHISIYFQQLIILVIYIY